MMDASELPDVPGVPAHPAIGKQGDAEDRPEQPATTKEDGEPVAEHSQARRDRRNPEEPGRRSHQLRLSLPGVPGQETQSHEKNVPQQYLVHHQGDSQSRGHPQRQTDPE